MALIVMPDCGIRSIEWSLDEPSQVNHSEFTGYRKIALLAIKPRWYANVTLYDMLGEPMKQKWRAFMLSTKGVANSFRLKMGYKPQLSGFNIRAPSGQTGYVINTTGWGSPGIKLRAGQFVTIADQLLALTQDVIANSSGGAVLTLGTFLRRVTVNNEPVEVNWPYATMSMSDPRRGWSEERRLISAQFSCEESFYYSAYVDNGQQEEYISDDGPYLDLLTDG